MEKGNKRRLYGEPRRSSHGHHGHNTERNERNGKGKGPFQQILRLGMKRKIKKKKKKKKKKRKINE